MRTKFKEPASYSPHAAADQIARPAQPSTIEKMFPTFTRCARNVRRALAKNEQGGARPAHTYVPRWTGRVVKYGFVFGLTLTVSAWSLAEYRERQYERQWTAVTGVSPNHLVVHFPKTAANESRIRLEELINQLGFTHTAVAPLEKKRRYMPHDYYRPQPQNRNGDYDASLPAPVVDYLDAHQSVLEAMYAHVLANPIPLEEMGLEKGVIAPIPNLLQHQLLHKTIAFDVLRKTRAGQFAEAMRAFEASWKINEQMRTRPEMISQMIAISVETEQLRLLTQMREVPREWQTRILGHDYAQSISLSLEMDSWWVNRFISDENLLLLFTDGDKDSPQAKILGLAAPLARPYFRAAVSRTGIRQAEIAKRLAAPDAICTFNSAPQVPAKFEGWPWEFNVNVEAAWSKAARTTALQQMTRKVLQVREAYASEGLAGVQKLKDANRPLSCPGELWDVEVLPNGDVELTGAKLPAWLRPEIDQLTGLPYKIDLK